jgi:hypothetical protein
LSRNFVAWSVLVSCCNKYTFFLKKNEPCMLSYTTWEVLVCLLSNISPWNRICNNAFVEWWWCWCQMLHHYLQEGMHGIFFICIFWFFRNKWPLLIKWQVPPPPYRRPLLSLSPHVIARPSALRVRYFV